MYSLFDVEAGKKLRDDGCLASESAEHEIWKQRAWSSILSLAESGKEFNADDVVKLIGPPSKPNCMGSLFLKAMRRGLIERVGLRQMERKSAHARTTFTYTGIGNDEQQKQG